MGFEPRTWVNGGLLPRYLNKNVSMFFNITSRTSGGTVLTGNTTDGVVVNVTVADPINEIPENPWVEVIGIPETNTSVRAKDLILFNDASKENRFNTEQHNQTIDFLQSMDGLFKFE